MRTGLVEDLIESRYVRQRYRVILWASRPGHGVRSTAVADIPADDDSTHSSWFARTGWPSAGPEFDAIHRGEATVDDHKRTVLLNTSSKHGFAPHEVIQNLKRSHGLQRHSFMDGKGFTAMDEQRSRYHNLLKESQDFLDEEESFMSKVGSAISTGASNLYTGLRDTGKALFSGSGGSGSSISSMAKSAVQAPAAIKSALTTTLNKASTAATSSATQPMQRESADRMIRRVLEGETPRSVVNSLNRR